MKVSVRNLGVIKEANFELKPLTVLIGPNNAGKTWLAYSLAGILGQFGSGQYAQAYADKRVPNSYEPLETVIEEYLAEGRATIDWRKFAEEIGEKYFNDVAHHARNWMHEFFSTRLDFSDLDVSLNLAETKADFVNQVAHYPPAISIGERIPPEEVRERLVGRFATTLRRSLYPQIYIFPTERTTLVTLYLAGRTNAKQQGITGQERETLQNLGARELIWPTDSFMRMLEIISENSRQDREKRAEKAKGDPRIKKYIELAKILEKQVLAGSAYLSTPEPDPRREVVFQPASDSHIEIPIASSMVKELAPLVLYLRHLAEPGEMLIIDEPEMNLHPAAQVQIIEFLAMLVNAGLHVLITTHSTYIVDHLLNLMDASKYKNQDKIVKKFLLKQKEAFIAQEKVSAYLVENRKVTNILDPEGEINWETFSKITALVERIHFELIEV